MNKNDIISKIYFDPSGYSSIQNTLKEVRQIDKTVKLDDVKEWFKLNVEQKTNYSGQNSYVAQKPYEEYQVDLFFINDLENQKVKVGMLMIDIFTKYMVVIPIASKGEGDVAAGLLEGFQKMGHKPEVIYADNETSMSSASILKYFKDNNILYIATRSKAAVAERTIRTFKDMLYKRIGNDNNVQWTDYIYQILLTYNNKSVHSSTKFTPSDARKETNQLEVKSNMELKAKHGRKYNEINVGDEIKIFKKKKTGDKQQVSSWSQEKYKVISIEKIHWQTFYKVEGQRPLLRHEVLKV